MNEEEKKAVMEAEDIAAAELIEPKVTRPYHRKNKHNGPDITPETKPTAGFYTHARTCLHCGNEVRVEGSPHPRGTSSADWEVREFALVLGWDVQLCLSGHLQYTCPRCRLKAA
jgi:hypothetical protein